MDIFSQFLKVEKNFKLIQVIIKDQSYQKKRREKAKNDVIYFVFIKCTSSKIVVGNYSKCYLYISK